jgi:hypothetical protein
MPVEHQIHGAGDRVIEARFQVTGLKVQPIIEGHYEAKKWVQDPPKLGGVVEMTARKHGTFGKATPNGNLSMMIANDSAFAVFKEAFERAVKEGRSTATFKVYFVEDEEQGPDVY